MHRLNIVYANDDAKANELNELVSGQNVNCSSKYNI